MELSYTFWEAEEGGFIGFINQFPDYWTQGETIGELEQMLASLYADMSLLQSNRQKPAIAPLRGTLYPVDISDIREETDRPLCKPKPQAADGGQHYLRGRAAPFSARFFPLQTF
jgi:predicted RNase H-like HicB family nuclease